MADKTIERVAAILQLFFDDYCLCFLLSCLPSTIRNWSKAILCFLFYTLAIVDIYCIYRLGTGITPTLVQVTLQTNKQEASEAFSSYFNIQYVSVYLILVLFLIVLHVVNHIKKKQNSSGHITNSILFNSVLLIILLVGASVSFRPHKFIGIFLMGDEETMYDLGGKKNYRQGLVYYIPVLKLINSLKQNTFSKQDKTKLLQNIEQTVVDSCSFTSPNIVVIVGESHNKHHSQLYEYPLAVTPRQKALEEAGNLIPFNDVITSYNVTTPSFKNIFSFFVYGEKGNWSNYTLFPAMFKKAGYHTAFITNQFTQSNNANMWDFGVDAYFNDKIISNLLFDNRNIERHQYDESVLKDYDSLKIFERNYNLTVFHLYGLHVSYKDRFPSNRKHFLPKDYNRNDLDEEQKQILADYDNAALYNDSILNEIICRFKTRDAIIVYLPDHGEECFDKCTTFGRPHKYEPVDLYQQFQIPFWVYMSDTYMKNHPQIVDRIVKSKDNPMMTDALPYFLLYLGGISSPIYNPRYNIIDPKYDQKRKRLIMGTLDYDDIMKDFKK